MIKRFIILLAGIVTSVLYMQNLTADIYKCTTAQGKVFYHDRPCKAEQTTKKMQSVKDPENKVEHNIQSSSDTSLQTGNNLGSEEKNEQKSHPRSSRTMQEFYKLKREQEKRAREEFMRQLE